MIIFNETSRAFVCGKKFILPGSNVVKTGEIDLKNKVVQSWIDEGFIRVENHISEKVAVEAISKANDQSIVDEIESSAPKSDSVKNASKKRKKVLDEFDAEVKAAIEKNKQKKLEEAGEA